MGSQNASKLDGRSHRNAFVKNVCFRFYCVVHVGERKESQSAENFDIESCLQRQELPQPYRRYQSYLTFEKQYSSWTIRTNNRHTHPHERESAAPPPWPPQRSKASTPESAPIQPSTISVPPVRFPPPPFPSGRPRNPIPSLPGPLQPAFPGRMNRIDTLGMQISGARRPISGSLSRRSWIRRRIRKCMSI